MLCSSVTVASLAVTEDLEPKMKSRGDIKKLLEVEVEIQEGFRVLLEFYYDNFLTKQVDDLKSNPGLLKKLGRAASKILDKIKTRCCKL